MNIHPNEYYHLYNRSNNSEIVFRTRENHLHFLKKYRTQLDGLVDTIGYCLMPTHFHFLIQVKSDDINLVKRRIGIWLSSYTKSINKLNNRHGSIFQRHTRAKHIDNESYIVTLLTYIHQNPLRGGFVDKIEDWEFSSYLNYIDIRKGSLLNKIIVEELFPSVKAIKEHTENIIEEVDKKYWI